MTVHAPEVLGRWIPRRLMNTRTLLIIAVLAHITVGVGVLSLSRMSQLAARARR